MTLMSAKSLLGFVAVMFIAQTHREVIVVVVKMGMKLVKVVVLTSMSVETKTSARIIQLVTILMEAIPVSVDLASKVIHA